MHPPVPFIVGVPRSGTTLLRLLLDAHPELSIPPETGFIPDALKALAAGPADPSRVLRWKRDMGAHMRERFEAVAGDLLQDLGYETGGPGPAASRRRLSSFSRRRRPTRGSASDP